MPAFVRPSSRALYPLGITFSMLVLAYCLNSVVEALLLRQTPVRYASPPAAAAPPETRLDPRPLAHGLGLSAHPRRARPTEASCPRVRLDQKPSDMSRPYDIRWLGDSQYEVSHAGEETLRGDASCVTCGPRLTPASRECELQGIQLSSVRPGSLAAHLGLRDRDILLSINGMALDGPESALDIYTRIKDASRIELLLERDGKRLRQVYFIQRA